MEQIVSKAYRMLGFVLRTAKAFKLPETYLTLYSALVRSQLEYAVVVWSPLYATYDNRIESIQKRFFNTMQHRIGCPRLPYRALIDHYNYCTLDHRRVLLEMSVLHNICLSHYDCPDLLKQINFRAPSFVTRTCPLFCIPNARTNAGVRAPIRRICDIYNRHMLSLDIFASSCLQFKAGARNVLGGLSGCIGK